MICIGKTKCTSEKGLFPKDSFHGKFESVGGIFSIFFSMHNRYKMELLTFFRKTYNHSETDNTPSLIVYMQLSGFPVVRLW